MDVEASTFPLAIAGSTMALALDPTALPAATAGPTAWAAQLRKLRRAGFDAVDLVDAWLTPGALTQSELRDLHSAIEEADLTLVGVSVIRRSVIDPDRGKENLAFTLKSLEAAAYLGAPTVSIGFHGPLSDEQSRWPFWMAPGHRDAQDDATWELAYSRVGIVAERAAALGISVSLELHEDTLLSSAAGARSIIEVTGAANLGINPDLGNLVRVPARLTASWEEDLRAALPYMNYWHVKNYARLEHPQLGFALSYPTELASGWINYRAAVEIALAGGYRGPICVEHYGGDALWAMHRGRNYLIELMEQGVGSCL
jgi:sugar phosphate isomerase/epimerase